MVKLVKLINHENRDEITNPNNNSHTTSDDEYEFEYENDGPPLSDENIENEPFNDHSIGMDTMYIILQYIIKTNQLILNKII